jgi:hypothetical protein
MKRRDKSQHKFEICLGYPCFSLELTPNAARTLTVFSLQRNKEVLGDLVTSPAAARLKNGECSIFLSLSLPIFLCLCACCPAPLAPHYKPPSEDVGLQPSRLRSLLTDASCASPAYALTSPVPMMYLYARTPVFCYCGCWSLQLCAAGNMLLVDRLCPGDAMQSADMQLTE